MADLPEQQQQDDDTLRAAFEEAKADYAVTHADDGTTRILQHLSNTIARLQKLGIEAGVEVFAGGSTAAYDLAYTVMKPASNFGNINAHGTITLGNTKLMFAVVNKIAEAQVNALVLSQFDVRSTQAHRLTQGGTRLHAFIPGYMYDFKTDPEALQKLEKQLVVDAAQDITVKQADPAGVFNQPAQGMTKPARKLGLK